MTSSFALSNPNYILILPISISLMSYSLRTFLERVAMASNIPLQYSANSSFCLPTSSPPLIFIQPMDPFH